MKRLLSIALTLMLAGISVSAIAAGQNAAEAMQSRKVQYSETDVVTVRTKVRFTTMVILPKEETILDFTCGDKEFWVVDGTKNLAYIKPAKAGARTNVNLVTAAGNVYSLILEEVSETADSIADLKLFIEPKEEFVISSMKGEPRFVSAEEVANYRDQASIAKETAREAKREAEKRIESGIAKFLADYPAKLKFDYQYLAGEKPFFVNSIWDDGRFTYIQANPKELPALYELKDGNPNIVNFDCRDNLITIQKVIDHGYLSIGKAKLYFYRKEKSQQ